MYGYVVAMRRPRKDSGPSKRASAGLPAIDRRHRPKSRSRNFSNRALAPRAASSSCRSSSNVQGRRGRGRRPLPDTRSGDVVIAHEQHVERQVLAEADQLVLAARRA